jgi:hypothetical protein
LATENADAQSRQNVATSTGSGRRSERVAGDGTAILAVRMDQNPFYDPDRLARCHLEIK